MLVSERIKISDTPVASAMRCSAAGADCANKPAGTEVAAKELAKQHLDIRFIVNHENEQIQPLPPMI